jgi:homoserine kinase
MKSKVIRIRVPATTANIGPGFDVLGAALKLYNEIEVTVTGCLCGPVLAIEGQGKGKLPLDGKNIVLEAMKKTFAAVKGPKRKNIPDIRSLKIKLINSIPLTSGLGSSAAARLAGILAANEIAGRPFCETEILKLGVALEGHPDNIVPAMAGGFCASISDNELNTEYVKLDVPRLKAVVCSPDFELSTLKARKVLPKKVSMKDAVFNVSRLALLMAAVCSGEYELLGPGMEDRLHQQYRKKLIPGMDDVFRAAKKAGAYGAAISGAGPSLIAFSGNASAEKVSKAMLLAWKRTGISAKCFILDFDTQGAQIYN